MNEMVVISGKGGTGKTSIVASLAALAGEAVLADADVDAADLHLVLEPRIRRRESFSGGKRARIDADRCVGCGKCAELCRFGAISCSLADHFAAGGPQLDAACYDCTYCKRSCTLRVNSEILAMGESMAEAARRFHVDPIACEGCGVCAWVCPADAIEFGPVENGQWFVSDTRFGPMVHARLGIAEENSGKLVSTVRSEARGLAEAGRRELLIVDGSPGTGCPVIASVTGVDLALIVTEPTLSGLHDLRRVAELTKHFDVPAAVCVNKWDLNPDVADEIESAAGQMGIPAAGRVRYDAAVTQAQIARQAVVEYTDDGPAADIRNLWDTLCQTLDELSA